MNNNTGSDKIFSHPLMGRVRGWIERFKQECSVVIRKSRNLGHTNFELGREMVRRDKINDAIFRFRMALWFQPNNAEAWFHLGCCYVTKEQFPAAIAAYRKALELRPGYEEALFMLASVDADSVVAGDIPRSMPLGMVTHQFDMLARNYNDMQLVTLGYRGHNLMYQAISQAIEPGRNNLDILELGCGTGLCGLLLRQRAARLVGVDISTAMLARAADLTAPDGRDIYDELRQQDIMSYLSEAQEHGADIICAANVFGYLGHIDPVFSAALRILRPGGLFAFSADIAPPPGYRLIPGAARFGHSVGYVRELAAKHGFVEISVQEIMIYSNFSAQLYVFRRP